MTSANHNATYHFMELDGTRIATPIARKRRNSFKKRHDAGLATMLETEGDVSDEEDEEKLGRISSTKLTTWHMPRDVRFGGGG